MNTMNYDELDQDLSDFSDSIPSAAESSPSIKLARRRKIEDLFEEKRLQRELEDFE